MLSPDWGGSMRVIKRYEVRSAGQRLAVEEASSPQEALLAYLRAHGCWDEEIVRMRPDLFICRGAVFTARLAASHLEVAS